MDVTDYLRAHMAKINAIQGRPPTPQGDGDFFRRFKQAFGTSPEELPDGFLDGFAKRGATSAN